MIHIKENVFHLITQNISYIFAVNSQKDLEHLYYGERIEARKIMMLFLKSVPYCLYPHFILKIMLYME